uniref:Neuroparsin 2 n=1 Tax=Plautia stali TaxID=106108 RepID=A0A1E1G7V4_PLAST|nr:neuroparsin 2 [Plautia stali]
MNSLILLAALSFVAIASSRGFYQCKPCSGEECDLRPEGCKHGIHKDPCGRWRCMAGPGERCGGRDNMHGKCGDGMTCDCGVCRGCSSDMYFYIGTPRCFKDFIPLC